MRGIEVVLLAAFIGLIGLGVWNARQWLPQWGPNAVNSAPSGISKLPGKLGEKTGAKTSRFHDRRPDKTGQITGTDDIEVSEFPMSKTEIFAPGSGFPTGKDIPVGASGAQIRARYGEPTARVTEMRSGHVLEHYYYFSRDRTQLTRATLESGIIVSADTTLP